jgi:hypothetical protein
MGVKRGTALKEKQELRMSENKILRGKTLYVKSLIN